MAGIRAKQLTFAAPVILVGLLLSLLLSRQISLLSLGDDVARGLGLEIDRIRTLCLFVVLLLAADLISRTINAPSETPVGLVFAVVGVPFFIWTARKEERSLD